LVDFFSFFIHLRLVDDNEVTVDGTQMQMLAYNVI